MPMTEQEVRAFLAQFKEAAARMKEWPQWMQDAAVVRGATFPKMRKAAPHQTIAQDTTGGEK